MFNIDIIFIFFGLLFITLVVFGIWFYIKKRPKAIPPRDAYLPPFKTLTTGKFKINYVQQGQGPDLVLLHGLGASVYIWRFIFKSLAKNYRVTAIDLPGFGSSTKDPTAKYGLDEQTNRLIDILNQLNIQSLQFIGSSMGGALALWMAVRCPERIKNVIALAPATNRKLVKISPMPLMKIARQLHSYVLGKKLIAFICKLIYYNDSFVTDKDLDNHFSPYKGQPEALRTFILATELITDKRLPLELKAVSCPVTLVRGSKDLIVPLRFMNELNKTIPHCHLIKIPNSGHHPMEESPGECVKILYENLLKDQRS